VIFGAGDGGALAVGELRKAHFGDFKILGFVDDDARKQRMRVQGYPVIGGYPALVALVEADSVDSVVISARMIEVDRLHELEELCARHGVGLSRLRVGLEPLVAGAPTQRRADVEPNRQKNVG